MQQFYVNLCIDMRYKHLLSHSLSESTAESQQSLEFFKAQQRYFSRHQSKGT